MDNEFDNYYRVAINKDCDKFKKLFNALKNCNRAMHYLTF